MIYPHLINLELALTQMERHLNNLRGVDEFKHDWFAMAKMVSDLRALYVKHGGTL